MKERGNFASKLGIVLATAGSAVGLGNIWRFPYMTGQNGGAAFLLLYIVCILLLIPGMVCEFIVGRNGQANAAQSYHKLSRGHSWKFVGFLGVITSIIILGFYAVVAGWCLEYLFASLGGKTLGDAEYVKNYFTNFSTHLWRSLLWGIIFILLTHFVIVRGVQNGIERTSKWLMPILFLLLVILVIASCSLPNAIEGVRFLLQPDFSKLNGSVFLGALGQAFFSLSLGTACLCTYASYFNPDTNLLRTAGQIAILDTLIAVLAGLMIFPAAFSVGISPDSGPSLIFITLPNVFQQAFGHIPAIAYIVSIMFYALLVFAAQTSTISMHEIGTAFFSEELHTTRGKAAWIVTVVASVICVLCAWSIGAFQEIQLMGLPLMDFCDHLTANYLMPAGGLLACIFVGWYVPRQTVWLQFTNNGTQNLFFFRAFLFVVRYISPLGILIIFLHQLEVI